MTTPALFAAAERGWKSGEAVNWQRPYCEFPKLYGEELASFVLPLSLAKPTNQLSRAGMAGSKWAMGAHKRKVWLAMLAQAESPKIRPAPLPGRPMIVCVRFSIIEPDKFADWAKVPIDKLLPTRQRITKKGVSIIHGLNYIVDDAPRYADVHQIWWSVSKRADEVAVLKIFGGKEEQS